MLVILGGRPGAGKSAIAREAARRLGAVWLRIDTIDQAIASWFKEDDRRDFAYRVAYGVAEDNLRLGRTVIGDSVNAVETTRAAWRSVAERSGCTALEVEVVCSDLEEHRRRIEDRSIDLPGLKLPTWAEIRADPHAPWETVDLRIDTAGRPLEACVEELIAAVHR